MISRRGFIKNGGALAVFGIGLGGVPAFVARAARQAIDLSPYKKKPVLICIFQRGAMDGLMAVSPFEDAYLKAARPGISLSAASGGGLTDLDGRFGLHQGFRALEPFFREKNLAIIHGMGSPNNTRSHFDAQDYMESGTPFDKNTRSGWLNRASGLLVPEGTPFRTVSLTATLPRSLYGEQSALAISNLADFTIRQRGRTPQMNIAAKSFEDLYDQATNDLYKDTGKETFDAIRMLEKVDVKKYTPANGAVYPNSPLGRSMMQLVQLIKADVGLEIGFAESGGWDTHFNQGTLQGPFARNAADLANSIAACWQDLGSALQDDVMIMTMTEFGRTVKQNGSGGTDHGRGSCAFLLGRRVAGGKVYGDVKTLAPENLEDGRDLAVTTDFRSVFSAVASRHLSLTSTKGLFPGWEGQGLSLFTKS